MMSNPTYRATFSLYVRQESLDKILDVMREEHQKRELLTLIAEITKVSKDRGD